MQRARDVVDDTTPAIQQLAMRLHLAEAFDVADAVAIALDSDDPPRGDSRGASL
jgi:hypothetical protein